MSSEVDGEEDEDCGGGGEAADEVKGKGKGMSKGIDDKGKGQGQGLVDEQGGAPRGPSPPSSQFQQGFAAGRLAGRRDIVTFGELDDGKGDSELCRCRGPEASAGEDGHEAGSGARGEEADVLFEQRRELITWPSAPGPEASAVEDGPEASVGDCLGGPTESCRNGMTDAALAASLLAPGEARWYPINNDDDHRRGCIHDDLQPYRIPTPRVFWNATGSELLRFEDNADEVIVRGMFFIIETSEHGDKSFFRRHRFPEDGDWPLTDEVAHGLGYHFADLADLLLDSVGTRTSYGGVREWIVRRNHIPEP